MDCCLECAESGALQLEPLATHHVPLDRVEDGLRLVLTEPERMLKVIVDVT